jgi:hypothetical protein
MTDTIVITIPAGTRGLHGTDAAGLAWSSWGISGGKGDEHETCAICGAAIRDGWSSGYRDGTRRYVCLSHVTVEIARG